MAQSVRRGVLGVGLAFAATLVTGERSVAQGGSTWWTRPGSARLTVRPTMAAGDRNPQAGDYPLASAPDYHLAVPARCAGTHRCPLIVFLLDIDDQRGEVATGAWPVADTLGFMLLVSKNSQAKTLDAALQEVLKQFAIDTAKIGIFGRGAAGGPAMRLGIDNGDVFSRAGSLSGGLTIDGIDPQNTTTEFFINESVNEHEPMPLYYVWRLPAVKYIMGFRGRTPQREDYALWGRWLHESWTVSDTAARSKPATIVDGESPSKLTVDVFQRMTMFWKSFQRQPDSIRTTARLASLHEVAVPGAEFFINASVLMMDTPALAARYPSVAADLKRAGLTAQEYDAYRLALLVARIPNQPSGENTRSMMSHPDEYLALWGTGILLTP